MTTTRQILASMITALKEANITEKVISHGEADVNSALASLRDFPTSVVVVVPGEDEFTHHFEDSDDMPVRSEIRSTFDLIICGSQLSGSQASDPKTLDIKDAVADLLCWNDLSLENFILLPDTNKPLALEFDTGKNREAWHLTIKGRQIIPG